MCLPGRYKIAGGSLTSVTWTVMAKLTTFGTMPSARDLGSSCSRPAKRWTTHKNTAYHNTKPLGIISSLKTNLAHFLIPPRISRLTSAVENISHTHPSLRNHYFWGTIKTKSQVRLQDWTSIQHPSQLTLRKIQKLHDTYRRSSHSKMRTMRAVRR